MSAEHTVDLDALLAPIPGDNPAGEEVRYAGPYDSISEARRADDVLDQGDWVRETKSADWRAVTILATETLSTRSKDLQIAAWMTEALVKQFGFAGLRDGLQLLRELQERFWDSLYPVIEDGDLEFRAGPLEWLNDKLPVSIREIPVTRSRSGVEYAWRHWDESRTVDNLGRQDVEAMRAALAEGKISGEQFDNAVAGTPRAHYEKLFADLSGCWEQYQRLDAVVDEKFGREAPGLLGLRDSIEGCRDLVERILKEKRQVEPDATPVSEAGTNEAPVATEEAPVAGGLSLEPRNRADALRRLGAVAAFFRRTEPHSPVAYLVQRAVQWGEMPLDRWLNEVIKDETALAHVRETLGLKDTEGGSEGEST